MLSRNVSARRVGDLTLIAYKASADIVSKAVTLIVAVAAARVLPAADFGVLALAMTTGWILAVASDAGLPIYLARRMAERAAMRTAAFADLVVVMRVRAGLGAIAALAGVAIALAIAPPGAVLAFVIVVVAQLLNAVSETLSHGYRGVGRSDVESSLTLAQKGVTVVAALGVLVAAPSLMALAIALACPALLAVAASIRLARRVILANGFEDGASEDRRPAENGMSFSATFFRDVAPVGAGILLSALYFRCDVYFVEWWHGVETVGVYNAAFRLVEGLRLFPAAALAVSFPALCAARDLRPLVRLTTTLTAFGVALAAMLSMAAAPVLEVVYGARFVEGAPALRVLALALPFFFANYALTHQVIAWDGQRSYLAITAAALATNVAGNMVLIPSRGIGGAATATLATEIVVTAGCLCALAAQRRAWPRALLAGGSR